MDDWNFPKGAVFQHDVNGDIMKLLRYDPQDKYCAYFEVLKTNSWRNPVGSEVCIYYYFDDMPFNQRFTRLHKYETPLWKVLND